MDIIFANERDQRQFEDSKELTRRYGAEQARRIRRRLDDLKAAPHLAEMYQLPGRFHQLTGERASQFAIDVKHPYRLIIEPADDPLPINDDGGFDVSQITRVRIVEIVDYH